MHNKTTIFPTIHATLASLLMAVTMPVLAHEGGADTLPEDVSVEP